MEARGHRLKGVRLDSGDLLRLSREVRSILDAAGLTYVQIFASGDLDEFKIGELTRQNAPIDGFGIGTRLGDRRELQSADRRRRGIRAARRLQACRAYRRERCDSHDET